MHSPSRHTHTPHSTSFAATLTDNAVLQRGEDVHATLYGVVVGKTTSSSTTVTVTVTDDSTSPPTTATLTANMIHVVPGVNATWKVLLKPHAEYGGNITATAQCAKCDNTTAVTIRGLTYGDVWLCTGQRWVQSSLMVVSFICRAVAGTRQNSQNK